MTDLTPNDLSHLSDAEFNSLCPQGEHAPGREPLSPAAQAVLDAFFASGWEDEPLHPNIAATLRAAADQVAPKTAESEQDDPEMLKGIWSERRTIRAELLAIAAELDARQ